MKRTSVSSIAIGGFVGLGSAVLGLAAGVALGVIPGGVAGALAAAVLGATSTWMVEKQAVRRAGSPPSLGESPSSSAYVPDDGHVPCGQMSARRGEPDRSRPELKELCESVGEIAEAVGILDGSCQRMADGASDQAGTVSRATNTVEALSDRIDHISQNAREAANATEGARQQAMRGLEQIQGMIEGMERLKSLVEANARKARRLGERSMEIGAIVKLIDEISNRTDMLALNATIESVRAGDHGRGFAVVAEEIRKLAERTAAATREIGTLVEAIQADGRESIRALAEEETQMENETRRVREAGSALERINRMAEDSARLVEGISHSANDQVLAARNLIAGMQRISEVTTLLLGGSAQIRQETRLLSSRCERVWSLAGSWPGRPDTLSTTGPGSVLGRHPAHNGHRSVTEITP